MRLNTAVFFDFENFVINCNIDNFIKKYQEQFVDRIKNETDGGEFAFIKIYADWSSPRFKNFASFVLEHGMEAVQVFGYSNTQESKNIADFMMSLDIFETALTKPHIENFVICTGDAGFSVIVNRLRASGKKTLIYRPERNYSRYLEKLADVCIGIEVETPKRVNIKIPEPDKTVTVNHPFTNKDLPQADKLNVKIMQPEFLRKFEAYGLTAYEADCSKQEIEEIIFGILQILSLINIYAHPQIVASISLLALLLEHYVENFSAKKYGHKTLSKLLNSLFTDTQYKLVRRNKESQYYIVVSEDGLRKIYGDVIVKQQKDEEKHTENTDAKADERPALKAEDAADVKPANKPAGKTNGKPEDAADVKPADKPAGKTNGKPEDTPAAKPADKPAGKINGNTEGAPDVKPADKPAGKTNGKPEDTPASKSADKPAGKTNGIIPKKPNENPSEKPAGNRGGSTGVEKTTLTDTKKEISGLAVNGAPESDEDSMTKETGVKAGRGKQDNKNTNIKMNDYIRVSITLMLKKNLLTGDEFNNLLDEKFSGEKFGIAHPLLKEVKTPFFPGSELYVNGKKVYWKRIFKYDGRYFLIYGNWKKHSQSKFIAWAEGYLK